MAHLRARSATSPEAYIRAQVTAQDMADVIGAQGYAVSDVPSQDVQHLDVTLDGLSTVVASWETWILPWAQDLTIEVETEAASGTPSDIWVVVEIGGTPRTLTGAPGFRSQTFSIDPADTGRVVVDVSGAVNAGGGTARLRSVSLRVEPLGIVPDPGGGLFREPYGYSDWYVLADFASYSGSGNLAATYGGVTFALTGAAPGTTTTGLSGLDVDQCVDWSGTSGYFRVTSTGLSQSGFAQGEGVHVRAIYNTDNRNAEMASFGARSTGLSYAILEQPNPNFSRSRVYNNGGPSDHVQNHGSGWILRDVIIRRTSSDAIEYITYSNGVTNTTTFTSGTFLGSTTVDLSELTFGAAPSGSFAAGGQLLVFGVRPLGSFSLADHSAYRTTLGL